MPARKIIHLDLDAFYCAVEEQRDPSLRGKPFAVGGRPDQRGVVSSCSYAARRFGVRSAMPTARAISLCPELIIISQQHRKAYSEASQKVMDYLRTITPLVEQLSIDEAFLDVSDIPEPPETTGRKIQNAIREKLGLPCSLGVASNKLVAKIATDVGKAAYRGDGPPNAILVVPSGEEAKFLAPLPVEALWGVGPKTAARMAPLGILTIGDIARWPEAELVEMFGKIGRDLVRRAKGLDNRPIATSREAKSISQERTFARDKNDGAELRKIIRSLSEGVGRQLRNSNLCSSTIKLKIRWPDFITLSRQVTLEQSTDNGEVIFAAAYQLFQKVWDQRRAVRLVGVGVSGLGPPTRQLSLWDSDWQKQQRLQGAVDSLQERFGDKTIKRGHEIIDT